MAPDDEPTAENADAPNVPDVPQPDAHEPAAMPLSPEESGGGLQHDGGTTRFLTHLLRLTPFIDLADRFGGDHPKVRMLCFYLDLLIRAVVVLATIAIAIAVAWKALAPLPHLWESTTTQVKTNK